MLIHYQTEVAEEVGVYAAILYDQLRYLSHDEGPWTVGDEVYYSKIALAGITCIPYSALRQAAAVLEWHGLVEQRAGFEPNSTKKTTYWRVK